MTTSILINLERHDQRRELALRRFRAAGLDPEVHSAVDGRTHPEAREHAPLTPGEVGCYLSHLAVMERVIGNQTSDYVLVLEDDAMPCEGFGQLLQQAIGEARARNAGLCQLGWLPKDEELRVARRLYERLAASHALRRGLHALGRTPDKRPPLLTARPPSWGAHCYLVAKDFAPTFASLLRDSFLAPLDYYFGAMAVLQPGQVLKARVPLAGQDWDFASSVHTNRSMFQRAQISAAGHVVQRRFSQFDHDGPDA